MIISSTSRAIIRSTGRIISIRRSSGWKRSSLSSLPSTSTLSRNLSSQPNSTTTTKTTTSSSTFTTINPSEIAHFSRLSSQWWDEKGEFGLLHKMNPTRMDFLEMKIRNGKEDDIGWDLNMNGNGGGGGGGGGRIEKKGNGKWLSGMDVLDVGCGGGLLSESLARVGGRTLAIDASSSNIAIASLHASQDPFLPYIPNNQTPSPSPSSSQRIANHHSGSLQYLHTSAEVLENQGRKFDVVCSMEVVEHVDEPGEFLKCLGNMVKPGGHLVLSTISRTPLSQFLTITLAEKILRLVTPGTHTHSKYIKPSELLSFVRDEMGGSDVWESDGDGLIDGGKGGVGVGEIRGIVFNPLLGEWKLWPEGVMGGDLCNYMFHMRKKSV